VDFALQRESRCCGGLARYAIGERKSFDKPNDVPCDRAADEINDSLTTRDQSKHHGCLMYYLNVYTALDKLYDQLSANK